MSTITVENSQKHSFSCPTIPSATLGVAAGFSVNMMDRAYIHLLHKNSKTKLFDQQAINPIYKAATKAQSTFKPLCFKAFAIFMSPVVEEKIFRGVFRDWQISRNQHLYGDKEPLSKKIERIGLNSGLFTLAHYNLRTTLGANTRLAVPIFASGVLFNGLMETTNNLSVPILGHSVANAMVFFRKK